MVGEAEDSLVRNSNRQWTAASRVEAEGLEWLYADPNAAKDSANQLEEYLLGKSIEGARGELSREIGEGTATGALLNDGKDDRALEAMLSKFREDPLFIIKKAELHQRQVLQKYQALAQSTRDTVVKEESVQPRYVPSRKEKRRRDSPSREHYRDRSHERYRDSHRRGHRERSSRRERHSDRPRQSASSESYFSDEVEDCRRSRHSRRRERHSYSNSLDRKRFSRERIIRSRRHDSRRSGRHHSSSDSSRESEDIYDRRRRGKRGSISRRSRSYSASESRGRDIECRERRGGKDTHRSYRRGHSSSESHSTSSSVPHRSSRHRAMHRRSSTSSSDRSPSRSPRRQRYRDDSQSPDEEKIDRNRTKHETSVTDKSSEHQSVEPVKRKRGPELPRKKDTLKYAFAVTDDIMPPQAIQDRAEQRRREVEQQKSIQRDLYLSTDSKNRIEEMQSHGSEHLKERLRQMEEHSRRMQSQEDEEEVQKTGADYISAVKQHAFETAKLAERIRQRAPKSLVEEDV